jgi:ribonuclease G
LSRKRTRESLVQQVCQPCESCDGLGVVKSPQSTCIEVFRALLREARACRRDDGAPGAVRADGSTPEYLIRTGEAVVDRLLDEDAAQLAAVSREIGRPVRMQVEPSYGHGDFDIVLV